MNKKVKQLVWFIAVLLCLSNKIFAQEADSTLSKLFGMNLEELMKLSIISAGKQPEKVTEIPASVLLITRNDIKTAGYTTLSEILQNMPGLFLVNDYYFNGAAIGVRGFCPVNDNHNIIILINGINQVNDLSSGYHLSDIIIPVEAIDRIEVIRGPMSVVYGSGASYGIINIITNESAKSQISGSAGSFKTGKLFGRADFSQNGLKCVVNSSFFSSRGLDVPFNKLSNTSPSIYGLDNNYSTDGKMKVSEKYMDMVCTYKSLTFGINNNESANMNFYFVPSPIGNKINYKRFVAFAEYKKNLNPHLTIDGKFTFLSNTEYYYLNSLFNSFYGNQHHQSHALETELNVFIKPVEQFEISAGVFVHSIMDVYNSFDLPSYNIPSFSNQYIYLKDGNFVTTRSFFTQVNYQPKNNLKFVAGVRLEQMPAYRFGIIHADTVGPFVQFPSIETKYNDSKIAIIPRFATIWSITDRNILKLMFGRSINRPSFFQTSSNGLNPNASQLQPEWITTYEMNYTSFINENLTLNAGAFYNSLDHLIVRVSKQDPVTKAFETWFGNTGQLITQGVELTLQANPSKQLRMELSGTFQSTKDQRQEFKNTEVAYSPKTLGYFKISYSLSPKTRMSLSGNYVGPMHPFYDETVSNGDGTYGARIGEDTKSYLLLNANFALDDLFGKDVYFNLKCNNLLNREIRYPTTTNNAWAEKGYLGAGINFLASIGKRF